MRLTINDQVYYSPGEVAKDLGVTRCTVTSWTKQGYFLVSQNKRVKRKIILNIYEDKTKKHRYIHQKTLARLIQVRKERVSSK